MFSGSSSSSSGASSPFSSAAVGRSPMTPPPPPISTSTITTTSTGIGSLTEFRKKTMQKIAKYASSPATSAPSSPITSPRSSGTTTSGASSVDSSRRGVLLSPHHNKDTTGKKATSGLHTLTHRIERFEEHDALLRQLEIQLSDMLTQLTTTCHAMGGVVEVFTQSFRYDAASYRVGVDYLAVMKQMRRERAHLMDQAVRFTVLDPLASRLLRHDQLHQRIADWKQLHTELEKEERKKWSDPSAVGLLREQLDRLERQLGEELENATNATAVHQQMDFFTTMRLQLATFFYHTSFSLFSRLSETEAEIVIGVGPSARSPVAGAIATRPTTKLQYQPEYDGDVQGPDQGDDGETEHETSSSSRGSKTTLSASSFGDELSTVAEGDQPLEEDDELRGSITLADFELGKPLPLSPNASSLLESSAVALDKVMPLPELLALASHPVVDTPHLDLDGQNGKPWTQLRHGADPRDPVRSGTSTKHKRLAHEDDSSLFSTLRKSFNEKFNSPKSSEKTPTSPTVVVSLPRSPAKTKHTPRQRRPLLTTHEWATVEQRLWALDTTTPVMFTQLADCTSPWSLPELLSVNMAATYGIAGFLDLASIARLAKTSHALHGHLLHCPAVWKRSIRQGSLCKSTRSAVWLAMLYGSTPWHIENPTTTIVAPSVSPTSPSSASLPHHLKSRELRKTIYESLLIKLGGRIADGLLQKSFDEDSDDHDTSRLVVWLREIDVDVVRTCSRAIYATQSSHGTPAEALGCYRVLLEGTIRRVLRAYVMYNPRVGYCQGMSFLVRLLMEVCGGEADEADCFWLFVGLCEPENDRNLYEPGLAVLQPLFTSFDEQLKLYKPALHGHLQREGVPVAAFTARWFLTLFSTCETFDARIVIRLLDVFVIDGWRAIFGMALVVLDDLESQLVDADMEAMLRMLQSPRAYIAECTSVEDVMRRGLAYSLPSGRCCDTGTTTPAATTTSRIQQHNHIL